MHKNIYKRKEENVLFVLLPFRLMFVATEVDSGGGGKDEMCTQYPHVNKTIFFKQNQNCTFFT